MWNIITTYYFKEHNLLVIVYCCTVHFNLFILKFGKDWVLKKSTDDFLKPVGLFIKL